LKQADAPRTNLNHRSPVLPPEDTKPMNAIVWLIVTIIDLYFWIVVLSAVLSWLIAFNVANPRNPIVGRVWDVLVRLTEPALAPIRRFLPNLGGIDISPVILILLILLIENVIVRYIYPNVF
jgi:YggT family protein